jgi:hypothetical protein
MGPMVGEPPAAAGPMQQAVRDATAAGPLIPNELMMMDANPSVRVGPQPAATPLGAQQIGVVSLKAADGTCRSLPGAEMPSAASH